MVDSQQTNLFSLFGIEEEVTRQQKKQEEERKKQKQAKKKQAEETPDLASSKKKKKAASDDFNANMTTFIRHLGEDIPLTDYFSVDEITQGIPQTRKKKEEEASFKKIDGESVRKRLEKDYPDLVAAYTEMVFIQKKNMIMPVPKMRKKGLTRACQHRALNGAPRQDIQKVPFSILSDFIAMAKQLYVQQGCEFHSDIYFNLDTDSFFLDVPHQYAHAKWVDQTEDASFHTAIRLQDIRFQKVAEIHSHHEMSPVPSPQDNESERAHYVYAIVGRLDDYFPRVTVRVFNATTGQHISLDPECVFESPFALDAASYDLSLVKVIQHD